MMDNATEATFQTNIESDHSLEVKCPECHAVLEIEVGVKCNHVTDLKRLHEIEHRAERVFNGDWPPSQFGREVPAVVTLAGWILNGKTNAAGEL